MLAINKSGWMLLEYLRIKEDEINKYNNVTGAFAIVNINGKFLFGYNKWRKQWELPAGGIENGESARKAAERELFEETHQKNSALVFRGLVKVKTPSGEIKYQAIYHCFQKKLATFEKKDNDEMDKIILWDLKQDIGYVDECDLKILELSIL